MTHQLNGHITPCWNINEIENLDFETGPVGWFLEPGKPYVDSGHSRSNMLVDLYFEPRQMPDFVDQIKKEFSYLNNLSFGINCIKPGNYLPWHQDKFVKYQQVHNINGLDKIYRAIIMVDTGLPGQYLHIGDQVYHSWSAGDWFGWYGDTSHATYNFSTKKRYAFQITGLTSE